ncbi:hypothetical protein [Frankia sp. CiP3]|uniref:hypothetical protein n=1 Tax=Frankia sp. CiP3 TaxID=2880971 RepID=UPI001EF45300|nr:hypothetical protein [Frankia sp. CiP3]
MEIYGVTVPDPHEWVDEPDPVTQRAIDEAREDLAAGRSVICTSYAAFDALLDVLSADSYPQAS